MKKEKYCLIDGSRMRLFDSDDGHGNLDKWYYCGTCGFEYYIGPAEEKDMKTKAMPYFRGLKFGVICNIFEVMQAKPREHLPNSQRKLLEEMASDFGKWVSRFR